MANRFKSTRETACKMLPCLEGRVWEGVGLLRSRHLGMRKPTHPLPLPYREGNRSQASAQRRRRLWYTPVSRTVAGSP